MSTFNARSKPGLRKWYLPGNHNYMGSCLLKEIWRDKNIVQKWSKQKQLFFKIEKQNIPSYSLSDMMATSVCLSKECTHKTFLQMENQLNMYAVWFRTCVGEATLKIKTKRPPTTNKALKTKLRCGVVGLSRLHLQLVGSTALWKRSCSAFHSPQTTSRQGGNLLCTWLYLPR